MRDHLKNEHSSLVGGRAYKSLLSVLFLSIRLWLRKRSSAKRRKSKLIHDSRRFVNRFVELDKASSILMRNDTWLLSSFAVAI